MVVLTEEIKDNKIEFIYFLIIHVYFQNGKKKCEHSDNKIQNFEKRKKLSTKIN